MRRFWPLLRRHRVNLFASFAAAALGMGAGALTPLVLRSLVDRVDTGRPVTTAGLGALLGLGVVRFVAAVIRRLAAGRVSFDVEYDLRTVLYGHLQRLDFAAHDRLGTGQLVSRVGSDVRTVQGLLAFLPLLSGNVLMLVASLVAMAFLSLPLTALSLLVLPPLALASARMRDRVFPATWDAQNQAAEVAGVVEESVTGVRVVKAFAAEERELARLEEAARALFASRLRLVHVGARLVPLVQVIPSFGLAALLLVGGRMTMDGTITLGTFTAFNAYLLQLAAPTRMLSTLVAAGQMARAGAVRILELLDSRPEVAESPDPVEMPDVAGGIRFEGVTFGYADGPELLSGFDLVIEPGERVALVGSSGSGKSTAALLLGRFYDPTAGRVCVDGHDITSVRLADLRSRIGYVFEDAFLFSASIRDNIAFGVPTASDTDVRAAARAAEADGFIEELPEGYETVVGERGLTLSGGQRQRITLARALLADPAILVLDDATSAVDPVVEAGIHATLRRLMAGRTTIVVAHRPSTVALAQRVVVMEGGRVVADGTPAELAVTSERYRALLSGSGPPEAGEPDGSDAPTAVPATPGPAGRRRRRPPAEAGWLAGRGVGGGGGMAGGFGAGAAAGLFSDEELRAKLAALPPADGNPDIDPASAAGPDPAFRLGGFVRPWRGALVVGAGLVALDALAGLAGPALVRAGLDRGVARNDDGALMVVAAIFFVVAGLHWWALWAGARFTGRLSERLLYALRLKVFAHLGRLSLDFYERERAGRVMTRMTSDIEALSQLFQAGFTNLVVAGLTAVGVAVALVVFDWRLAGATMAVVPVLVALTVWFRRSSDRAYARVRDKIAGVMASLQEGLAGVRVTQAFNREDLSLEQFRGVAGEHLDARLEGNRLSSAYFPAMELLGQVATVLVVAYGSRLALAGTMSPADLVAFILYLNLFFAPIQQLSAVFDVFQQAGAAADKLAELLAIEPSVRPGTHSPGALSGRLRFEGVRFRYQGAAGFALDGIDLDIAAGETVALVGRTGAGKSTVIKLLARFYDPTEGQVTADGTDISEWDTAAWRRRLGLVPQEAHLFSGSVAANVAYGRPDATLPEVEGAARAVGAHEMILALPDGYQTRVGEGGRSLSSGQRQLVALARARLVDPTVLLLDEATSSLDLESEGRVVRAMGLLSQGRTTVLVAHRLATAARADRIVVLDAGRIVEDGNHSDLLARDGPYAAMWRAGDPEATGPASGLLEPA